MIMQKYQGSKNIPHIGLPLAWYKLLVHCRWCWQGGGGVAFAIYNFGTPPISPNPESFLAFTQDPLGLRTKIILQSLIPKNL